MADRPKVSLGDWIYLGRKNDPVNISAVVCNMWGEGEEEGIEVVYIDNRNRAINKDVIWVDDYWEFKDKGPSGGYADNYDRLSEYVSKLRRGRLEYE